jgi:hypothetical protein
MPVDLDALAQQQLGKWPSKTVKKELAYLPTALFDGETVENLAVGDYKDRMGKGLLVLTDRRLLFIESSGFMATKMNVEDFALDRITSIRHQLGGGSGTIEVFVSGNNAKIESVMPKERVEEISGMIRTRINAGSNAPSTPVADPSAQMTQLKALLDAGVLTQDEFDAKKSEILSRM